MSAAAAAPSAQPMFQTNTIAALVPNDARNKKRHIRAVLQAFAEQFGQALSARLQAYCALQKVRTVTAETLRTAAEELLGAGAASVPAGIDEASLPSTMVFLRFRRSLGGLRLEASCSRIVGIVGFNFLRYVQDILERVYGPAEDAKTVELSAVIAALERPNAFSASGMPCIAYRHDAAALKEDAVTTTAAAAAEETAAATTEEAPAAKKAKAPRKSKKAAAQQGEEQKAVVEATATVEAPVKKARAAGKKRERKEDTAAAVAAPETAAVSAAPAPKKRGRKALQQTAQEAAAVAAV
jgi:hypothetical protein